jgi:dephospho-CoA kinase
MQSTLPIVGITGGIGSGKSMVAQEFGRLGAQVIDADVLAHRVLASTDVLADAQRRWGTDILDAAGSIDRRRLAKVVFAPTAEGRAELHYLEGLTHPRIRRLVEERVAELSGRTDVPAIIVDAPLLVEAGWHRFCDRIVYVEAPRAVRLDRSRKRGWSQEDFDRREARQESLEVKRGLADVVIDNSGSLESTRAQAERAWHSLIRPTPSP